MFSDDDAGAETLLVSSDREQFRYVQKGFLDADTSFMGELNCDSNELPAHRVFQNVFRLDLCKTGRIVLCECFDASDNLLSDRKRISVFPNDFGSFVFQATQFDDIRVYMLVVVTSIVFSRRPIFLASILLMPLEMTHCSTNWILARLP